ncbi:MAG: hypothetical protein HC783_11865 [Rhodobacteraceae bacterium]|nr:hypothetical protein [Paracoccaceae bacterium]
MGDIDPPHPSPSLLKTLVALSGRSKRLLRFVKGSLTRAWKRIKGPEPVFLARLSLRMDLLEFYDFSGNIERYRIQKNGEFPVLIVHQSDDSYRRMTFSRPRDKLRSLLFPPFSDESFNHGWILWSWTSDGIYLRLLIGEASMLLTLQEAIALGKALFPESQGIEIIKSDE